MQQQHQLINTERRYQSAFEKSKRENQALQERINLQNYTIKRLRREVNQKNSFRDKLKKFFGIFKQKKGVIERPLRNKENQRKLIAMLENGLSIVQIANETGWKKENIRDFIKVHSLKFLIKRK